MKYRPIFFVLFAAAAFLLTGAEQSHKLEKAKGAPDGLAKSIAESLDAAGHRVAGPDGAVVEIWFRKDLAVKSGFSPTFEVKYPFKSGELIGSMRIPEKSDAKDFRGQEVKPGLYTLRYGQQPQDGNHIGTSALRDFLLAVPAKEDKKAAGIEDAAALSEKSAKSAGGTHPAIFSLLPTEKGGDSKLEHDADKEFWILNTTLTGKADAKEVKVPMRLVVIGQSEG